MDCDPEIVFWSHSNVMADASTLGKRLTTTKYFISILLVY